LNIFYLDKNPKASAEMHVDKHVSKMLVEYAQLMSTSHRVCDGTKIQKLNKIGRKMTTYTHPNMETDLYKSCHVNHPSNIWLRQSIENYEWLYEMWLCLHKEFQIRYGKDHMSYVKLKKVLKNPPVNCTNSPFTQAMPDDVKDTDSVVAYRNYYRKYKKHIATWKTEVPAWY
jgi:RNase P subunit RPR2